MINDHVIHMYRSLVMIGVARMRRVGSGSPPSSFRERWTDGRTTITPPPTTHPPTERLEGYTVHCWRSEVHTHKPSRIILVDIINNEANVISITRIRRCNLEEDVIHYGWTHSTNTPIPTPTATTASLWSSDVVPDDHHKSTTPSWHGCGTEATLLQVRVTYRYQRIHQHSHD